MKIPCLPIDPMSKFKPTDCSHGAPVLDSAVDFNGILCCSSCRGPMLVNVIDEIWVHS